MKKITLLFALLTISLGFSQNTVTVDVNDTWVGYMNVFDNPSDGTPDCGGGFCFGSGWGTADLVASIDGSSNVTLLPNINTYNDNPGDGYWRDNDGAGPDGNKIMEANFFVEPGGTFNGVDLTFTGEVSANTIDSRYTVVAFIKTIGGTSFTATQVLPASGTFTVSATGAEIASGIVQYGFTVTGLNANPADDWGSVSVSPATLSTNEFTVSEFSVFPNPATDNWTIKGNQQIMQVEIVDILGKSVLNLNPNNFETTVNASSLNSGLYFARIKTESGINSVKLIKK